MMILDPVRCTYCGGCVSVCPLGSLVLAETRLLIDESCVDCGECVPACPVGALRQSDQSPFLSEDPEKRSYDLVVVGAGPGGSMAAKVAAQAGLSVLLLEKRQEIGSPVRCAEGVGHAGLVDFLEPEPGWVAAEINKAAITAVAGGEARRMSNAGGRGYILERRVFDRVLAEQAAQAGAEVRVKTAASGLLLENRRLKGIIIQRGDFAGFDGGIEVEAHIVIAADGIEAQVGRWAGLMNDLPLQDTMVCAQYLLAGVEVDPTCTSYTLGFEVAPGGYAWVFPKGEKKANVGLGVQADLWEEVVEKRAEGRWDSGQEWTVLKSLDRFIEGQAKLSQGYPVTLVTGNVPVACASKRLVSDGLMLVGDAGRQVDPLTGGGIIPAMAAGKLAAEVAVEAVEADDATAEFLSRYQDRWLQIEGRKQRRNYRLRSRFSSHERVEDRFLRAFALAVAGG